MLASMIVFVLLTASASLFVQRTLGAAGKWVLAIIPLVPFGVLLSQIYQVLSGILPTEAYPWMGQLGLELAFRLDALSLLFGLIISGMGTLIVLHTGYYLEREPGARLYFAYLLLFIGALLGLVLAANTITMAAFWLFAALGSYLLVGYRADDETIRHNAQQALLVTMGGGLLLLSGLLLLGQALSSLGYAPYAFGAAADPAALSLAPGYVPAVVLIMLGCMAGAAQVPFHFWLPGAVRSTAPLNAFPHLVMAVLAGLYPLARLHPLLGDTELWRSTLAVVGALSLLFGALMALRQHDLKQLLAYALTSQLGLLVLLTGLDGLTAPAALVTALLGYVLAAGALFMLVGSVTRIAGTCDLRQLGQLHRAVPITTWLTVLAGLSLAGMPLFVGFVVSHLLFESIFASSLSTLERFTILIVILLGLALSVAYTWRLVYSIFFGAPPAQQRRPLREAPAALLFGPGICTSFLLVLGLPVLGLQGAGLQVLTPALLNPAASVVAGAPVTIDYGIWQDLGLPLVFSWLVIGLGGALIQTAPALDRLWGSLPRGLEATRLYDALLRGVRQSAHELTGALQNGRLRVYLSVVVMMLLGLAGPLFLWAGRDTLAAPGTAQGVGRLFTYETVLALLVPAGVLVTMQARSRLVALLGVSTVGAVLALFYVLYSAPDLALVQVLVSAIGSTLLLLVFSIIPARFDQRSPTFTRIRDGLVACAVGVLLAALTYTAASTPAPTTTAAFYLESGPIQARSDNVVQAIMLDFRSFDTLGVITLLFASGLGIYGLLRLRRSRRLLAPPASGTQRNAE